MTYTLDMYLHYLGLSDDDLQKEYKKDFASYGKETIQTFITRAYQKVDTYFSKEEVRMKKGARELLQALKKRNIPCLLASSNQKELVWSFVRQNELVCSFDHIFTSEDVKKAKPDPELYERAAFYFFQHNRIEKKEICILEDSLNGVIAGTKAKIPVYFIPDLLQANKQIKQLATAIFPDLTAVLNQLNDL